MKEQSLTFKLEKIPGSSGFIIICYEVLKDWTSDNVIVKRVPCQFFLTQDRSSDKYLSSEGIYIFSYNSQKVYSGKTNNFKNRLITHRQKYPNIDRIVHFVPLDNSLHGSLEVLENYVSTKLNKEKGLLIENTNKNILKPEWVTNLDKERAVLKKVINLLWPILIS